MQTSESYRASSSGANITVDTTTTHVVTIEAVPPVEPERPPHKTGCFEEFWGRPNDQAEGRNNQHGHGWFDSTYLKTTDGILRIAGMVTAGIGMIFIFASVFVNSGGWFFFVAFWFIVYCVIFIVVGTCVPSIYFHRLVDAIIMFAYAVLWFISALLNTIFAAVFFNVLLGISSIFAYICTVICILTGLISLRTWKTHGQQNRFTVAVF